MSTRRNTLYNLVGAAAPVLMMLASVPLYIHTVGEARYGVLALVWIFTGYFSFFDFGLGRATAYAIARARDEADQVRAQTFWTALAVNLAFGAAGGLVVLAAAPPLFNEVFNLTPTLRAELAPALPWLALAIPLLTMEGVFSGALTGRERFLALNARSIAGTAITQFLPLAFVWSIAPTLAVAIPATILARTISVALLAVVAFRAVPAGLRPRFGGKAMVRDLLGYGGWVSLGSFLDTLVVNADRFLIAAWLNATAVAHYVVPLQVVSRGSIFARALASALFPKMARYSREEAQVLALRALRANAALMTVLVAVGIVAMHPFLSLWIGADFAASAAPVGQQLAISVWLTALAIIPYNLLQAQGQPRDTVVSLVLQAIPFILVAIPALSFYGLGGIAAARNFRSLLNLAILARQSGLLARVAMLAAVPLAILLLLVAVLNVSAIPDMARTLGVVALLVGAGIYSICIFPEGLAFATRLVKRLAPRRAQLDNRHGI